MMGIISGPVLAEGLLLLDGFFVLDDNALFHRLAPKISNG